MFVVSEEGKSVMLFSNTGVAYTPSSTTAVLFVESATVLMLHLSVST